MTKAAVRLTRAHAKGVEHPMGDGRIFAASVGPTRRGGDVVTFR